MGEAERSELWSLYVESDCSQAKKEDLEAVLLRLEGWQGQACVPNDGYVEGRRAWTRRSPADAIYACVIGVK